jgi:aminoglycoside N3'-acetyltransferase
MMRGGRADVLRTKGLGAPDGHHGHDEADGQQQEDKRSEHDHGSIRGVEAVPMTPTVVAVDLRRLGVRPGDVLMVHASLRAIGPVAGGADGVVDAIREALGPEGTMVMVLGAMNEWAWVNERPEADRPQLLRDAVPFDAAVTPADPDVGVLAEVFRQRPETGVSDHPEGRFAAAGPLAPDLLRDVPWDDYYGHDSPLDRLIGHAGRVLRLGADRNTVTILHRAESLTSIEPKRRSRRHRLVAAPGGPQIRVVDTLDDEDGIVEYEGDDYFEDILVAYLDTGRARSGSVGQAHSELIEAADLVDFGVRWMEEHLQASALERDRPRP